jgi:CheY-like chemotaxis protein
MSTQPDAAVPPSRSLPTVLVVDDSHTECRLAGAIAEKHAGLRAVYAYNGQEALAQIVNCPPDVVLTDLQMPIMDGLELVTLIRDRFPRIPVILMTAVGSEEIAIQALRRGAASYLPKKSLQRELAETLHQVLSAARVDRQRQRILSCLTERHSRFTLDNDPALVPQFIAMLQEDLDALKLFDDTGRIRVGVALEEALLNALYHGNLECSSDLRQQDDNAYHDLAMRRRREDPFQGRRLYIEAAVSSAEALFVIRDEGPGFDPAKLPDPTDAMNLGKANGRGLLLIRTFMDDVAYNASGNEIRMRKRRTAPRGGS